MPTPAPEQAAPPAEVPVSGGRYARHAGLVLLALSMVFSYAMLMPTLGHGMLTAGDDAVHAAYALESVRLWQEERTLFGWTDLYGFGEPVYLARPPGFYWVVLALHGLSFGALPLIGALKLAYLLSLVLYPAAVYYLLWRWRCSPLVRGVGAMLALAPISTFGHTLDAYYSLGLAKQAFALLLFPVALGKLHGIVHARERVWSGALLVGLMVLNHPYIAWVFGIFGGVLACIPARVLGVGPADEPVLKSVVRQLGRLVMILLLGAGLSAFWLVPYACSPEIQSVYSLRAGDDRGFDKQGESTLRTLKHVIDGSLLDRSPDAGGVFGGASPWAWRDNSGRGRWPVLTVFGLAGLVVIGAKGRRSPRLLLALGAGVSGLLFLGSDDVPLLRLIPLERDFQYIHVAAMVDLLATCLAAVGLAGLAEALARAVGGRLRSVRPPGMQVALAVLVAAPFMVNVLMERWQIAAERVVPRRFEVNSRGQTTWSLRNPGNAALDAWARGMRETVQPQERFLADAPDIWKGSDIFHFTLSPAYLARANVLSPVVVNLMGGVNQWVHFPPVRAMLPDNETLADLLRIRAVVHPQGSAATATNPLVLSEAPWRTLARRAPIPAFGFTAQSPHLVVGDQMAWERICREWTARLATLEDGTPARWPPLVWVAPDGASSDGATVGLPLDAVSSVVAGDGPEAAASALGDEALRAFTNAVGPLLATMPWTLGPELAVEVDIADTLESRHHRATRVRVSRPGLLYLKTAYYRGWGAYVNGQPVPLLAVSPGFNGCWLDAGEHQVEFRYEGATGRRTGFVISGLALLCLPAWPCGLRRRRLHCRP